jgi:adenine specific DNA methylase Mod
VFGIYVDWNSNANDVAAFLYKLEEYRHTYSKNSESNFLLHLSQSLFHNILASQDQFETACKYELLFLYTV